MASTRKDAAGLPAPNPGPEDRTTLRTSPLQDAGSQRPAAAAESASGQGDGSGKGRRPFPVPVPRIFQALALDVPAGLDGVTQEILRQIASGRRAAVVIALLIAEARRRHFEDDPSGWLAWARDQFGYERRHCFACLKAGMLLLAPDLDECGIVALLACDVTKIELLAAIPPHQLPALLARWNPAEHSRDEVRAKVRLWDPQGEEPEDAKTDAKAKAKPRPRSETTVENLIDRVAAFDQAELDELAKAIDPAAGIRAACKIFDAALTQLDAENWWTAEQYALFAPILDDVTTQFRRLQKARQ